MSSDIDVKNKTLFRAIKVISNKLRFKIIELSQENTPTISELSASLKLSYTKCADYVTMLEHRKLVTKTREGKNIRVKSNVKLSDTKLLLPI